MKNILATSRASTRFASFNLTALAFGASMVASALWGTWATSELVALKKREVVTVELGKLMGEFVEGEARAGRSPEETRARITAYLLAIEASVAALGREGRTVLVAEAVVAGSSPDLTAAVRTDVAARMKALPDARR